MCENRDAIGELRELLAALREDVITDAQAERLTELLRSDREARQTYIRYMAIAAQLHGGRADSAAPLGKQREAIEGLQCLVGELPTVAASLPVGVEAFGGYPSALAPWGGLALSYAAAAVIVGIGLLIGWAWQVSTPQFDRPEFAGKPVRPIDAPIPSRLEKVAVGRITGMVDCHWADPREAPIGFDRIAAGRRYVLVSGLMEITYDTGARVILQGPCDYAVDSKSGGYLSLGRLTAKVEKKAGGGRRKADGRGDDAAPVSVASPLFLVRTPTATIADLGTEFGVEVDQSGASRAHVFQGKVELRVVGQSAAETKATALGENESARVDVDKTRLVSVTRERSRTDEFVRQMPKRTRIKFFNTGANVKVDQPDAHWQVVARSDEPNFKPRQAIVTAAGCSMWLPNQEDRSQWISVAGGHSTMPDRVVCTFRTTFDLTGLRPVTTSVHGWFAVDNCLRAIRINGREIAVPKHGHEEFGFFHSFAVERGFVEGVNVLEFDVENGVPLRAASSNPMGLLVELEGTALSSWPEPSVSLIRATAQRK
jgi:hypothetical protein